jgi:superfamily II DNA or RNA helicase
VFNIDIYPTHISISNAQEAVVKLEKLIELFEYEDEYEEVMKTLGYVVNDQTDTLYFNKGVDIDYIRRCLGEVNITIHSAPEPAEMFFEYEEIIPPRDEEQVEMINFVSANGEWAKTSDAPRIFMVSAVGTGKTYTSCVGAVLYKKKTLIICHRSELLKQWRTTLIEKIGMNDSDIHTLSTEDFLAAEQMELDLGDVYLLSHQTFRFALRAMNGYFERVGKAIENLGIGLKIIDEAHLEFHNIVLIDMCMNVKRNLYLTATDGRSSKEENTIFKYVFTNAIKYTKNAKHKRKWIEYCTIFINTNVPYKVAKFQLENGRGMNATKYGKAVIKRDKNQTHFNAINELLRLIFTKDEHAKVLIFMPLIELCEELEFFINTHLNKDQSFDYDLRVGTINSHNTKAENEHTGKCDVIISTILSCGTGKDIPGLTDIICCSPFKSAITTEQVFGRLRYYGKNCGYWDIVDESVKMDMIFAKLRLKTIKNIALSMSSIQFSVF